MRKQRIVFRNSNGQWIKYEGWFYEVHLHNEALRGTDKLRVAIVPNAGHMDTYPPQRLLLYSLHFPDKMLGHADTNPYDETWRIKR